MRDGFLSVQEIKDSENYWFLLTDRGMDGAPALSFYPTRLDPEGMEIQKHIIRCRLAVPRHRLEVKGTARCTQQRRLVLTSTEDEKRVAAVLDSFVQHHPELKDALAGASLIQTREGSFVSVQFYALGTDEDRRRVEVLTALQKTGGHAMFWFNGDKLFLESDWAALRLLVKQSDVTKRGVRGILQLDADGRHELQIKADSPTLLSDLKRFVRSNRAQEPSLYRLRGSYVTVRAGEGIIEAPSR
jgi:hypothetical protein